MAYNPTTGIITAPVSVYDLQQALGTSGNGDVGTLDTHANVKLMSKFKPTDYKRVVFNPVTDPDYADSQWKGEMVKQEDVNVRASVGIHIPYGLIPDSLFNGSDYQFFSDGQYRGVGAMLLNSTWQKKTPTVFRLLDFWKYIHKTPDYPIARNKYPISFANLNVQTKEYNTTQHTGTLLVSAEIHFDYNDISVQNIAYYLGVKNLFDAQNGDPSLYNLKFGFMILSASASKTHFAITDGVEMQLDNNYDADTGLTGHRNIAIDDAPLIKPLADANNGFQVNEEVYVLPYIRRTINVSDVDYRCYFCLNADNEHLCYRNFTIKSSGLTIQAVRLTSATIKITYQVVNSSSSTKTIRFRVKNVNDMVFTFSGYSQDQNANKFYFLTSDFGVTRNDGNGYMVQQYFAELGTTYDDSLNARYSRITQGTYGAVGILNGVQDAQHLSNYYTDIEYNSELTEAKIGISMLILENNGSGEMVQRSVSFNGTINPKTTQNTESNITLTTHIN